MPDEANGELGVETEVTQTEETKAVEGADEAGTQSSDTGTAGSDDAKGNDGTGEPDLAAQLEQFKTSLRAVTGERKAEKQRADTEAERAAALEARIAELEADKATKPNEQSSEIAEGCVDAGTKDPLLKGLSLDPSDGQVWDGTQWLPYPVALAAARSNALWEGEQSKRAAETEAEKSARIQAINDSFVAVTSSTVEQTFPEIAKTPEVKTFLEFHLMQSIGRELTKEKIDPSDPETWPADIADRVGAIIPKAVESLRPIAAKLVPVQDAANVEAAKGQPLSATGAAAIPQGKNRFQMTQEEREQADNNLFVSLGKRAVARLRGG